MTVGVLLTAICVLVAIAAVISLFRHEPLGREQLRVQWGDAPQPIPTPDLPIPAPALAGAHLAFVGPDRYCPSCGRLLVKVNENGTLSLAPNTTINTTIITAIMGEGEFSRLNRQTEEVETLIVDAVCLDCNPNF